MADYTHLKRTAFMLLAALCLAIATSTVATQQPGSGAQPVYLSYVLEDRPAVRSPDGKLQITVTGLPESLKAWVTVEFLGRYVEGLANQEWPIQRGVDVLWRPDSKAFALTDERYANLSYVLVLGTDFRVSGQSLGVPVTDLTPTVRGTFEKRAQKYYAPASYHTLMFYARALRWEGTHRLLVGLDARTIGPASLPNRGIREWYIGYLVDVPGRSVLRQLGADQVLSQYGIDLNKQNW